MSRCERCGAGFTCGPVDQAGSDAPCWCAALPRLPAEMLVEGRGCLCPDCLKADLDAVLKSRKPALPASGNLP